MEEDNCPSSTVNERQQSLNKEYSLNRPRTPSNDLNDSNPWSPYAIATAPSSSIPNQPSCPPFHYDDRPPPLPESRIPLSSSEGSPFRPPRGSSLATTATPNVDESVMAWSHEVPYVVGSSRMRWSITTPLIPTNQHVEPDTLVDVPKASLTPITENGSGTPVFTPDNETLTDPFELEKKKLVCAVLELVQSEADYLEDLASFRKVFLTQLKESGKLSDLDINYVFGNLEEVIELTQDLLQSLENATAGTKAIRRSIIERRQNSTHTNQVSFQSANFKATKRSTYREPDMLEGIDIVSHMQDVKVEDFWIGSAILLKIENIEKVYCQYFKHQDLAYIRRKELDKNEEIHELFENCRQQLKEISNTPDLQSNIMKPAQRIFMYPLLLQRIVNSTPEIHPDHWSLVKAINELRAVTERIDQFKKQKDLVHKVFRNRRATEEVRSKSWSGGKQKSKEANPYQVLCMRFEKQWRAVEGLIETAKSLEEAMKKFNLSRERWIMQLEEVYSTVAVVESDKAPPLFLSKIVQYRKLIWHLVSQQQKEMNTRLNEQVLNQANILLHLFKAPSKVMRKRDEKAVDYDKMQLLKSRNQVVSPQLQESATEYECLDLQLVAELPRFLILTERLFTNIVRNLMSIQKEFQKSFFHDLVDKQIASKASLRELGNVSPGGKNEGKLGEKALPIRMQYVEACKKLGLEEQVESIKTIKLPEQNDHSASASSILGATFSRPTLKEELPGTQSEPNLLIHQTTSEEGGLQEGSEEVPRNDSGDASISDDDSPPQSNEEEEEMIKEEPFLCTVAFPYIPEEEAGEHLPLRLGDVIKVEVRKVREDRVVMFYGSKVDDSEQTGWFPAEYVSRM